MNKIFIDVETSGLDPQTNGIIQLACIIGKEEFSINIKPFKNCKYDDKALEINNTTREQINTYTNEKEALYRFMWFLETFTKRAAI